MFLSDGVRRIEVVVTVCGLAEERWGSTVFQAAARGVHLATQAVLDAANPALTDCDAGTATLLLRHTSAALAVGLAGPLWHRDLFPMQEPVLLAPFHLHIVTSCA